LGLGGILAFLPFGVKAITVEALLANP